MAPCSIRRRDFTRAAGFAALAAPRVAGSIRGANDRVNLAFLGEGRSVCASLRRAAQVPGFEIVAACDVNETLADQTIDAVCIAVPPPSRAQLAVEACRAGKDVYLEGPAFLNLAEGRELVEAARQYHRVVQAGTWMRSGTAFQQAREIVGLGGLGEIAFCRTQGTGEPPHLVDLLQFLFDEAAPLSAGPQGSGITFRYPGFLVFHEVRRGADAWRISIHGSEATLSANPLGYSIFPGNQPVEHRDKPSVAHWRNFLECIRSRQRPVSDIETCLRSTTAWLRAELAMRHTWRAA